LEPYCSLFVSCVEAANPPPWLIFCETMKKNKEICYHWYIMGSILPCDISFSFWGVCVWNYLCVFPTWSVVNFCLERKNNSERVKIQM
jgi:hypothetical protein